jgi:hypothetical protein
VIGFRSQNIALLPLNFLLGSMDCCLCLIYLSDEFRNFQDSQYLSFMNPIADINVDLTDIAGYLSVQIHVLIREELTCNGKRIGNGAAFRPRYRNVRWLLWGTIRETRIRHEASPCAPCNRSRNDEAQAQQGYNQHFAGPVKFHKILEQTQYPLRRFCPLLGT